MDGSGYGDLHTISDLHIRLWVFACRAKLMSVVVCEQLQSCPESGTTGGTWSGAVAAAAADQRVERQTARRRSERRHDGGYLQSRRPPTDQAESSPLSKLVRETQGRLSATRDMWLLMPQQVCDELAVRPLPDNSSLCWNGRSYRCCTT